MARRVKGLITRTVEVLKGVENEILLETPITLPTAYPATPDLTFTITAENLPTVHGGSDVGIGLGFFLCLYMKTGTSAYSTGTARFYINGVAVEKMTSNIEWGLNAGTANAQRCYICFSKIAVKAGDVVTVFCKGAANFGSLYGGRISVLPWGYCGLPSKKRNIYITSLKTLEVGLWFEQTIGRTVVLSSDSYCTKKARKMSENQASEYTGADGDAYIYSNSTTIGKYLAGGGVTDYRDTTIPYLICEYSGRVNLAESGIYEPATTLFLTKNYYIKKAVVKFKVL